MANIIDYFHEIIDYIVNLIDYKQLNYFLYIYPPCVLTFMNSNECIRTSICDSHILVFIFVSFMVKVSC